MYSLIRLLGGQKLLIALSSLIMTLSVLLICLNTINSIMQQNIMNIRQKAQTFRTDETIRRLDDLEKALSTIAPPYLSQRDAKVLLIESLENFRSLYNGKILNDLTDDGGSFTAQIEFTIEPTNPAQITGIADYLENSTAPIFIINNMTFLNDNKKTVKFTVTARQPYYGGVYEY